MREAILSVAEPWCKHLGQPCQTSLTSRTSSARKQGSALVPMHPSLGQNDHQLPLPLLQQFPKLLLGKGGAQGSDCIYVFEQLLAHLHVTTDNVFGLQRFCKLSILRKAFAATRQKLPSKSWPFPVCGQHTQLSPWHLRLRSCFITDRVRLQVRLGSHAFSLLRLNRQMFSTFRARFCCIRASGFLLWFSKSAARDRPKSKCVVGKPYDLTA